MAQEERDSLMIGTSHAMRENFYAVLLATHPRCGANSSMTVLRSHPKIFKRIFVFLSGQLVTLQFEALEQATGGWSKDNTLGQGAYATVYRADLPRDLVAKSGLGKGILNPSVLTQNSIAVACKLLESDSEVRQKEEAKRKKAERRRKRGGVMNGPGQGMTAEMIADKVEREMEMQHKHLLAELAVMSRYHESYHTETLSYMVIYRR